MTKERIRPILGKEFIQYLYQKGIVPYWTQSVDIHADLDNVLIITIDQIGTSALMGHDVPPVYLRCPWCGSGVQAIDTHCKSCGGSTVVGQK